MKNVLKVTKSSKQRENVNTANPTRIPTKQKHVRISFVACTPWKTAIKSTRMAVVLVAKTEKLYWLSFVIFFSNQNVHDSQNIYGLYLNVSLLFYYISFLENWRIS